MPVSRYRSRWPEMRAFALPALYDGRIRVNLEGREAAGVVPISEYEGVVDDLEELVRSCVDPRTGESVVESVDRAAHDPRSLGTADADLVIEWRGSAIAFDHPRHGLIGPVPYRRTGGHTGPYGFASLTAAGVRPGDYGVASSFDVAPTIVELVSDHTVDGISGTSLLEKMRNANSRA
jgi:predicted AlkP superfamily phosphohydrolase/phosphomutase